MQYDSLPFQYACKICDFKADSIGEEKEYIDNKANKFAFFV